MLTISVERPPGGSVLGRRAFLRASVLTAGAFGLPGLLCQQARAAAQGRPRRDTAVIQIWLGGGPSHLDMYDLKPAAPAEVRGPFRPIAMVYQVLGIEPGAEVPDALGRPVKLLSTGEPIRELF
jgi:hypothetical protein